MSTGPGFFIWKTRTYFSLIVLVLVSMFLVSCGNSPDQLETISGPSGIQSNNMSDLSGDIAIDGSSTVFPIVEAVAEEFGILTGGNVRVILGKTQTSTGVFYYVCNADTIKVILRILFPSLCLWSAGAVGLGR